MKNVRVEALTHVMDKLNKGELITGHFLSPGTGQCCAVGEIMRYHDEKFLRSIPNACIVDLVGGDEMDEMEVDEFTRFLDESNFTTEELGILQGLNDTGQWQKLSDYIYELIRLEELRCQHV